MTEDPTHHLKSVRNYLHALAKLAKSKRNVDNHLVGKLVMVYDYMVFGLKELDWDTDQKLIMNKASASLEHRFNDAMFTSVVTSRRKSVD